MNRSGKNYPHKEQTNMLLNRGDKQGFFFFFFSEKTHSENSTLSPEGQSIAPNCKSVQITVQRPPSD